MLVLAIDTVLQFCRLRYKMLVRPTNLSLWYYVKDNVVLQALCPSSLYTKSKSTMLGPLKGEVGHELSTSKWSNSDSSSFGFLLSNWLNSLIVLLNRPFFSALHCWQYYCVSMFICYMTLYNGISGRIKKRAAHSENFLGGLVCTRNLAFRLQ